jgi:hypothetical protein
LPGTVEVEPIIALHGATLPVGPGILGARVEELSGHGC